MDFKNRIDLTSATSTKPNELVDNNSNHTPTCSRVTTRLTFAAHNKESCNSLTSKVDRVLPNPFNPKEGLKEGVAYNTEVATFSGLSNFSYGIKQHGNTYYLTGISADQKVSVLLPRTIRERRNKFDEYADLIRALGLLLLRCYNLPFQPAKIEERGFKRIIKNLWP